MRALIALRDTTVFAFDERWYPIFHRMAPVPIFGGTELLIDSVEDGSISTGIRVIINSPYYPKMMCLVPERSISQLDTREVSGDAKTASRSHFCSHTLDEARSRCLICPGCFRKVWVSRAKELHIDCEDLKVKGIPKWITK